jgi:Tfp pilus assembly protein PilV
MSFKKNKQINNQIGTTLVEILVAMTIFGVITMGIAEFFRSTEKSKKKIYVKRMMESLSENLYNKVSTPFSVYVSLADTKNTDLINCVERPSSCSAVSQETALGFSMAYETSKGDLSVVSGPLVESGLSSDSICYDTNGASCSCNEGFSEAGASCIFIAETSFYVRCEKAQNGQCDKEASSIHLSYRVRQKENSLTSLGREMKNLPEREFFVHHPLDSVFDSRFNSQCNLGAAITGFSKTGRAICECASEYTDTGEKNERGPICKKTTDETYECGEDMVPVGLTKNHRVRCIPFADAYACEKKETCLEGEWLQKHYRKTCKFNCRIDSWDGGECENLEGVSCAEVEKVCCHRLFPPPSSE